MQAPYNLQRFTDAQQDSYATALAEIRSGRKRSHWMWYIFPQVKGLGFSQTSKYYAIADLEEARLYLNHAVLGRRLTEISQALLSIGSNDAQQVFGSPDDLKLKSSMTLFALAAADQPEFHAVLNKFFNGEYDAATSRILTNP